MYFNFLEMKFLVFCVTLSILFFANIVSSTVTIVAQYDDIGTHTKKYEIHQALQLACNVSTDALDANQAVDVTWEKNQQPISKSEDIKKRASLSHKDGVFKFQLSSAVEEDAGEYACVASISGEEKARAIITVQSKIYVKIPRDISVIEGEKLRVACQVHGNPLPNIVWIYKNKTYEVSEGRVQIEADKDKEKDREIPNAVFMLTDVTMEDQGELICKGISRVTNEVSEPAKGVVRVKDKYAALWPFLGICAEVIILCAIILIYEKKRNKTELEESDTDQSPEQKNTPDHGGKESNLRHRQ